MKRIITILLILLTSLNVTSNNYENIISKIEEESDVKIPKHSNIDDIIYMYNTANELEIPIRIAFRLVFRESSFIAEHENEQGYMQVIPTTFNSYYEKLNLTNLDSLNSEQINILIGMTYLKEMHNYWEDKQFYWKNKYDKENLWVSWDSWKFAVASYNGGKNRVIDCIKFGYLPESKLRIYYINFIIKKKEKNADKN